MKTVLCSYTILRTFEVEDSLTYEDIDTLIEKDLEELGIKNEVNDIEYDVKED